jgi:large subunit ribosomal protein L7/L12
VQLLVLFTASLHLAPSHIPVTMSLSSRYAAQCCARHLRSARVLRSSASIVQHNITRRNNSTEAAASPKIAGIVDQISQLTLLETADLVASLKVRVGVAMCPVGPARS